MSEDKIGKPLKLGALWWLTGGFKKAFKSRFSILTTNYELDWYKKQEDSKDGKRGGALKKLNNCRIEEIEDQLGQSHCFLISLGNKNNQILAADTERERMNWIVEILKFRGIEGLIAMIKDSEEKLSRHAAYALCNLAGRSKDDTQIRIVDDGGVEALLAFQKTCEEADLVDSINFSFCKLSSREENKIKISSYLSHFYDLLDSQNERWIDFSLQTILNFSTNDFVQQKIVNSKGLQKLTDIIASNSLKENLLRIAVETIHLCSTNDKICAKVISDYLPSIAKCLNDAAPVVKEQIVKLLSRCFSLNNELKIEFIEDLIPLLSIQFPSLQMEVIRFLSTLSQHKKFKSTIVKFQALPYILEIIKSEDKNIILYSLETIFNCWCVDAYCPILASSGNNLISIVNLLSNDAEDILDVTLSIFLFLSMHQASLKVFAEFGYLAKLLVHKLLLLQVKNIPENLQNHCISILNSFSKYQPILLAFCHNEVFEELITQTSDPKYAKLLVVNLSLLSNCCNLAIAKKSARNMGLPVKLLDYLLSENTKVQIGSLMVLNSMLLCPRVRDYVSAFGCIQRLISLLPCEENVRNLAIYCLSRLLYSDVCEQEIISLGGLSMIIKYLDAQCIDTVKYSILAIRNCCGAASAKLLRQSAIPFLVKLLKSDCKLIVENASYSLARCFTSAEAKDTCFETFWKEGGVSAIINLLSFKDPDVQEVALWTLSDWIVRSSSTVTLTLNDCKSCVISITSFCYSNNSRNISCALEILNILQIQEISVLQNNEELIFKLIKLIPHTNIRIGTLASSILLRSTQFRENKKIILNNLLEIHKHINFVSDPVRNILSFAILNVLQNDNKEIAINSTVGLETLFAIWKGGNVMVNEQDSLKLKVNIESQPYSVELLSNSPSLLNVEYSSSQILAHHIAASSVYFTSKINTGSGGGGGGGNADHALPSTPIIEKRKNESSEKKSTRKKRSTVETPQSSENDNSDDNRSSRSGSFLPGTTKRSRPKLGINAGFYRTRSSITIKDDKIIPRPVDSFKSQLISLTYYRSMFDDLYAEFALTIQSYIKVNYTKDLPALEDVALEVEPIMFQDPQNQTSLKISQNIVEYTSQRGFGVVGVAQSVKPLNTHSSYGYFEVLIISSGRAGCIGVGVACNNYPLDQQPGWKHGSFGYHGDDGNKYWYDEICQNSAFGPTFTAGDIIGCGINNVTQHLFFTKNGMFIDSVAITNLPQGSLYPTVGLGSFGEKVLINQGQFPFLWDYDVENTTLDPPIAPKAEYGVEKDQKRVKRDIAIYEIEFEKFLSQSVDWIFNSKQPKRKKGSSAANNNNNSCYY